MSLQSELLTRLPSEILLRVTELLDPPDLVDLACTCKSIAWWLGNILRRHREAHDKYHVTSDLLPSTVPALLRTLITTKNSVEALHVRSLEFWGTRSSWGDWKPFMLQPPDRLDPTAIPLTWSFSDGELEKYSHLLRDVLHLSGDNIDKAMQELKQGNAGILKVLLIALCPRMKSIKYIWCDRGSPDSSLAWLTTIISDSWPQESWAPGLESLQEVAIGVNSGTWLDADQVDHPASLLATLYKLPEVKSIYFQGFVQDHEDQPLGAESVACFPPVGKSSVEHLFIDKAESMGYEYRKRMVAAPRALKTLALSGNERSWATDDRWHDIDQIVGQAKEYHRDSLESLMLYEGKGLHGYRCVHYLTDEVGLSDFGNLRQLYVDGQDLINGGSYFDDESNCTTLHDLWPNEEKRKEVIQDIFLECVFPRSMEVLVLGSAYYEWSEYDAGIAETCLIKLMKSDDYEDLKAIYFEDDADWEDGRQPPRKRLWLQRLIAAGKYYGVDVYARSNPDSNNAHDVEFPTAPDETSLKSGPHVGARDVGEWRFNPSWGAGSPGDAGTAGIAKGASSYTLKKHGGRGLKRNTKTLSPKRTRMKRTNPRRASWERTMARMAVLEWMMT